MNSLLERCPFCGALVETPCDSPPPALCSELSELLLSRPLKALDLVRPDVEANSWEPTP